jgi:hypothetical protein
MGALWFQSQAKSYGQNNWDAATYNLTFGTLLGTLVSRALIHMDSQNSISK